MEKLNDSEAEKLCDLMDDVVSDMNAAITFADPGSPKKPIRDRVQSSLNALGQIQRLLE